MPDFTRDYDPGFLNVPGFGQSVTNPLSPVFYESLGVVKDLAIYGSSSVTRDLIVGLSATVGESYIDLDGARIKVPVTFERDVTFERNITVAHLTTTGRLIVAGKEYKATTIVAHNGTFTVLAAV